MPIHIGHRAERLRRRLTILQEKCVAPSIRIVYFKTCLNAWITERRMASFAEARTLEGCPFCERGKDSIEHFAVCKECLPLFCRHNLRFGGLINFLGLYQEAYWQPAILIRVAKVLSILYLVHNTFLHTLPADRHALRPCVLINAAELNAFRMNAGYHA